MSEAFAAFFYALHPNPNFSTSISEAICRIENSKRKDSNRPELTTVVEVGTGEAPVSQDNQQ